MLRNLLDNHPDLTIFPWDIYLLFVYFPKLIGDEFTDEQRKITLDRIGSHLVDSLTKKNYMKNFNITNVMETFLEDIDTSCLKDMKYVLSRFIYSICLEQPGRKWTVLKESSIEIYASEIFQWFPKAKMCQIIRDPRDNYAALKSGVDVRYSKYGEDSLKTLASHLNRCLIGMRMANINMERFGEDRYLVLRFEDIVNDCDKSMGKICDYLGIEINPDMLKPTVMGMPEKGNNFDNLDFTQISDHNVSRWKERIHTWEAKIIEWHFSEMMEMYGYKRCFSDIECADAAAQFYKWQNYEYFYTDRFSSDLKKN